MKDALHQLNVKKIVVIGDVMLDLYTFGDVERISPEAPVPIVRKKHDEFFLGGAANVANNIVSLGSRASLFGIVGNDAYGDIVLKLLRERGIGAEGVLMSASRPTTVKQRIVSGGHQLLRIDEERTDFLTHSDEKKILDAIAQELDSCDLIVFSDYAKGCFSDGLSRSIIALAKKTNKKILANIKPSNKKFFLGVDVVTSNVKEAEEVSGVKDIIGMGKEMVRYFDADIVITKGGDGMSVFKKNGETIHLPAKKVGLTDVTGAGDTVVAIMSLGFANNLDVQTIALLANYAGSVAVQKPGIATVSLDELSSLFSSMGKAESLKTVSKVWGSEKWLENNEKYCCKTLELKRGYQCSLHYHKNKDETFLVLRGTVRMEVGNEVLRMVGGDSTRIYPGTPHRFRGVEDSVILEISTHHDEEDSYRIEPSRKV